jgi:abhydrolase domain-containing protein 5
MGPWGPDLVRRYTGARFGSHSAGGVLSEEESTLFTGISNYSNLYTSPMFI